MPPLFWALPLWAIFLIVTAVLLVGHEAGVQIRRRTTRSVDADADGVEAIGGSYLTASLSLLALLVAFSFSMGVERYNSRSALVREEANLISTAWRRLDALPTADKAVLVDDFAAYVESRWAFSQASTPAELHDAEKRSDELGEAVWSAATREADATDFALRTYLDALNAMFNIAAARRAAIEAVIPRTILLALLLYAVIAVTFMGYSHPNQASVFRGVIDPVHSAGAGLRPDHRPGSTEDWPGRGEPGTSAPSGGGGA